MAIELVRRAGFVASPRVTVPVLLAVVAILAFFSIGGGTIPSARVYATVVVGAGIVALFGLLALLTRAGRGRASQERPIDQGASS